MWKYIPAAACLAALLTLSPVTAADTTNTASMPATATKAAPAPTEATNPQTTQTVLVAIPASNQQLGLNKTLLKDFVTRTKALFPYPAYGTREKTTNLYPTQVTLAKLAADANADIVVMPAIKTWNFRTLRPSMDRFGNGDLYTEIDASISLFVYDRADDQLSEMTSSYHALNQSLSAKSEGEVLAYLMMHLQRND